MSKIGDELHKVGDILNPFDDIGKSVAKGATAEALRQLDEFMEKHQILAAIADGKRVDLKISIQAVVAE